MDRFTIKPIDFNRYDEEYVRTSLNALKLSLERLNKKQCEAREYLNDLQILLVEHRDSMEKYYYRRLADNTINCIESLVEKRGEEFRMGVNDLMKGLNAIAHLEYGGE